MPGNGDGRLGTATLFAGGLTDSAVAVDLGTSEPSIVLGTDGQLLIVRDTTPAK